VAETTQPALLDGTRAAAFLGITARTLRRWDAREVIPDGVEVNGRRYWRRSILETWLRHNCPRRRRFRVLTTGKTIATARAGAARGGRAW